MASRKALLIIAAASMAVVVGALLPATASARQDNRVVVEQKWWSGPDIHVVGDADGWGLGVNYDSWSRANDGIRFGDTIHFMYDPAVHNVVQVNSDEYNRCIVPNNPDMWDSGDDFLKLVEAGTYYFICGMGDHCSRGMKVIITAY